MTRGGMGWERTGAWTGTRIKRRYVLEDNKWFQKFSRSQYDLSSHASRWLLGTRLSHIVACCTEWPEKNTCTSNSTSSFFAKFATNCSSWRISTGNSNRQDIEHLIKRSCETREVVNRVWLFGKEIRCGFNRVSSIVIYDDLIRRFNTGDWNIR